MRFALIAAAGYGRRLGLPGGKQYVLLHGRPLLYYTLKKFVESDVIDYVLPVINPGDEDRLAEAAGYLQDQSKLLKPVRGGRERYESVRNGLLQLLRDFDEEFMAGVVLIHDGARPLVSTELIARVVETAEKWGAVVPAVPVADTIKEVRNSLVVRTLRRSVLRAVQTPQGFRGEVIYRAYTRGSLTPEVTDDAALVEKAGYSVRVIEGERTNIKLTYPDDLAYLERMIAGE